ncbi:hypothetical protein LIER_05781 [Lithospermum erythrorhizon]|uniref:Uncharacterized protein n=1 Tax=Lithospermum erythrorhizon TaxID=34254 RepID=A0AAV3P337_LITER
MGPRVPIQWTARKEVGSLFVRDTTFIKSQVHAFRQAILEKPTWTAYCEESALIMAGLIHDKMYDPCRNPLVTWAKVWEAVQNVADPTGVEVASVKGKHLPRFSRQLVIRKPLVSGSNLVPVFPAKRNSSPEFCTYFQTC